MKQHLLIEKEPYEGTYHNIMGFYYQDMTSSLALFHAKGQELLDVTQEQIDEFGGKDVFTKDEKMWVYDSSIKYLALIDNPEFPYPEE